MRRLSLSKIVEDLAEQESRRIANRTIRALQRMRDTLSGDDSGLATTWEEVCVQVQCEHSIYWSAYVETIDALVGADVAELQPYIREAIWLQTQQGWDWDCEDEDERDAAPVYEPDVTEYIVSNYVMSAADNWSNSRIRAFKERRYEYD